MSTAINTPVTEVEDSRVTEIKDKLNKDALERDKDIDYANINFDIDPPDKGEYYKGLVPIAELAKTHQDIPKHFKNIQSAKTKAEQRAAALQKELDALKQQFNKEKEVAKDIVKQYKPTTVKQTDYDLTSEEGYSSYLQALANAQAQQAIHDMLKPKHDELEKELAAAKQTETMSFIEAHTEFEDESFFESVVVKMEQIPNLTIEEAYLITKSKYKPAETLNQVVEQSNKQYDKRNDILSIGGPGKHTKPVFDAKGKSAYEIYEWHRQHGRLDDLIKR